MLENANVEAQFIPMTYQAASGWRKYVISIVRFFLKRYYKISISPDFAQLNEEMLESDNGEQQAYVLIANHQNFWDVPLIILAMAAWIDWVCKCELFRIPLFGTFLHNWAAIPFDRNKTDLTAIKTILKRLKDKRIVGIFPQGHRCRKRDDLYKYQASATIVNLIRKAKAKVILIGIEGEFKFRGELKIHLQKPFTLSEIYDSGQSDSEIVYDLMQRVYRLANREYPSYKELQEYKEISDGHKQTS